MTWNVILKKIVPIVLILFWAVLPILVLFISQGRDKDDLIRIAHISLLSEKIQDSMDKNIDIPLPKNALEIRFKDREIWYQWQVWSDLFYKLWLENLQDPSHENYYYYIRPETWEFELVALLNNEKYANIYYHDQPAYSGWNTKGKFLTVTKWENVGKLVSSTLTERQVLDLQYASQEDYFDYSPPSSCQEILSHEPRSQSWSYLIQVNNDFVDVYCDMDTDGGGWTLLYANNGHADSPTKMSYVNLRKELYTSKYSDISHYYNPNLVGLLNYDHFINLWAHEILIKNSSYDGDKWVKMTFSLPQTLQWALGIKVLWNQKAGCLDLPNNTSWDIVNSEGTLDYKNLHQIVGHYGNSWWVSHVNIWCNGFSESIHPHLAFYNAMSDLPENRARSNDEIGWSWGGGNEYRYFIR